MSYKIDILSTGSHGNCIIVNDELVIDLGLKKQALIEHFDGVEKVAEMSEGVRRDRVADILCDMTAILITHRHTDHIQVPTLNAIHTKKEWKLKTLLYANQSVNEFINKKSKKLAKFQIDDDHLLTNDSSLVIEGVNDTYTLTTFELNHDVPNQGFIITNKAGEKLVYATDTSTMKHCPQDKYDFILVEGNYDEDKVYEDAMSSDPEVAARALSNLRHLSVQAFEDFVRKNSKPDSIVYQLHESGVFGLRSDLVNELES